MTATQTAPTYSPLVTSLLTVFAERVPRNSNVVEVADSLQRKYNVGNEGA